MPHMDISGPVRQLLRDHLPAHSDNALLFAARAVALPAELVSRMPEPPPPNARPSDARLGLAMLLRLLPRVGREIRDDLAQRLSEEVASFTAANQKLLVSRTAPPVDQLWLYWILALAKRRLKHAVPDMQLKMLWQHAWTHQTPDGTLHPPGPDDSLDAVTYNDLIALHAAYNAVLLTHDFDLFPPIQKLADFHIQRTQPDHITTEPWALAAFAALDQTNTFAGQQIHDATTRLTSGVNPVVLGLLADALLSQEDAANM
jgi:hypothetical protein